MMVKLKSLLPYFCLAAVAFAAVVLRLVFPHRSPVEVFLDDSSIRTSDLSPDVQAVILFLTNAAHDPTRWTINEDPRPGAHTLILFSGTKARTVPDYAEYVKTIAWVSEYNTIVVDVDYLRELAEALTALGKVRIENPYERDFREDSTIRIFLLWVVGHEAGHAHYHDATRHFSASSFEAPEIGGAANQEIEIRADNYMAYLVSSSREQLRNLSEMLFQILNVTLEARMPKTDLQGPLIQLFSHDGIEVLGSGSHPEFVVRAARLLAYMQYPSGTEDRYGAWAAKLLERINSAKGNACSVMVRTSPVSADVSVQLMDQRPVVYSSPASPLLSPGHYHLAISAEGFKSITEQIAISDCQHVPTINIVLERVPAPPRPPPTLLEEFVSRRESTIHRVSHARYLQQLGLWKGAEWELDRATEIDPASSDTVFLQALVKEHEGRLTAAKDLHNRAVDLLTHEITGYDLDAYRLNQIQKEMSEDTQALLRHPKDQTVRRSIGEMWLDLGRYDLAQPFVYELEDRPGSCEDHVNMARLLLATGRPRDAKLHLKRAISCTGPQSIDEMIALAAQLEGKNEEAAAEQWFVNAYKGDPENAWIDLCSFLRRRGRPREALSLAQAAVKRSGDDTDALNEVAQIEFELRRLGTAELWFKRALRTYTDNAEALQGLAQIAARRDRWDQARMFCGDAVKGNSWDNFDGWVCVGDAEQRLRHPQLALSAYQNASWLRPRDENVYYKIGQIYAKLSDSDQAALYDGFARSTSKGSSHLPGQ
jgi:tetratricopeptide (TPR) repeat protein